MTQRADLLDPTQIDTAVRILRAGGLVAIPTETVYGLAADATNARAVASIYDAKGRPSFNPLITHVASLEQAQSLADFSETAFTLANAFWPGPLTLVLPVSPTCSVSDIARAGLDTIAIRIPAHPVTRELLSAFGGPVVAPSANPSGKLSPTDASHVVDGLGERIDGVLDGGPCARGIESTVVAVEGSRCTLLRTGALPREEIEHVVGPLQSHTDDEHRPTSPGMLLKHYAPNARLRLNANAPEPGEAFLGFADKTVPESFNLSPSGDLAEAAANLFRMLRALDVSHDRIAVAPIPDEGLGEAINDRLRRAALRD